MRNFRLNITAQIEYRSNVTDRRCACSPNDAAIESVLNSVCVVVASDARWRGELFVSRTTLGPEI